VSKAFSIFKVTAAVDILLLGLRGPLASYIAVSCCDVYRIKTDLH
jgi:hypothetical protein